MKKLNRKGFTLIELLSIIVIISLISGITITLALTIIDNAKTKSKNLTINNIKGQAEKYIYEGFKGNRWYEGKDNTEFQCVTVRELIEAGYFKKDLTKENDFIKDTDIITVTRNKKNKSVIGKEYNNTNSNNCSQLYADINSSLVQCEYEKGWKKEKNITITYQPNNMLGQEKPINGVYLSKIGYKNDENISGLNLTNAEDKYYTTQNETINITATSNGYIYANAIYNDIQIGSLNCIVSKIDNIPPLVLLASEEEDTVWINKNKSVTVTILVNDDGELANSESVEEYKNKIKLIVGNSEQNINKLEYIKNESSTIEAYYKVTLSNITGNGDLSIKIPSETFKDMAENGNEETILPTNIKVDNTAPQLKKVTDKSGKTCYENSAWKTDCNSWHAGGYYQESFFDEEDGGSPILGGYLDTCGKTKVNEIDKESLAPSPIKSYKKDNNKCIYIMDEAENFSETGPYIILVDTEEPNVEVSISGKTITCTITDNKSKVGAYKLCKEETCDSTSYTTITPTESKTVTQSNLTSGIWNCYGKDTAGNEGSDNGLISTTYKLKYNCGQEIDDDACQGLPTTPVTQIDNNVFSISTTKPTRTGYKFLYWMTASGTKHYYPSCTSVTDPDCKDNLTMNNSTTTTLYAQWIENTNYKLNYNCGEGVTCQGLPTTPVTQTGNNVFSISTTKPTRTNYTFLYWMTASGTKHYYPSCTSVTDPDCKDNLTMNNSTTTTLYAQWEYIPSASSSPSSSSDVTYRIKYNCGEGVSCTNLPSDTTGKSNPLSISTTTPKRTNYTFLYWMTASGTLTYCTNGCDRDSVKFNSSTTTTLYAHWKKIPSSSSQQTSDPDPVTISATFKGYYSDGTKYNAGEWSTENIKLKGNITTNASYVYYEINKESGNLTSGGEKFTDNPVTKNATSSGTYYLHIRYKNEKGQTQYLNKNITVNIDKTAPTCTVKIDKNNQSSGIQITKTCSDTGGSGCTSNSNKTYTGVKESKTYTVKDNAGNTGTCKKVTVSKVGYKNFCDEAKYGDKTYSEGCYIDVFKYASCVGRTASDGVTNICLGITGYGGIIYCSNDNYVIASGYYTYNMLKKEVVNKKRRCTDTTSTYSNTGSSPYLRAIKRAFKCDGNVTPQYQTTSNDLNIRHSYYTCQYESTFSKTDSNRCTTTEGKFQRPTTMSERGWRCIYVYKGTIAQ